MTRKKQILQSREEFSGYRQQCYNTHSDVSVDRSLKSFHSIIVFILSEKLLANILSLSGSVSLQRRRRRRKRLDKNKNDKQINQQKPTTKQIKTKPSKNQAEKQRDKQKRNEISKTTNQTKQLDPPKKPQKTNKQH